MLKCFQQHGRAKEEQCKTLSSPLQPCLPLPPFFSPSALILCIADIHKIMSSETRLSDFIHSNICLLQELKPPTAQKIIFLPSQIM